MDKKLFIGISFFWFFFMAASLYWNYNLVVRNNDDVVLNKSKAFFDQIIITRSWNAMHGGVYVPVTEDAKPNEYLVDSTRDVMTAHGVLLTKINPAYMTRQIAELNYHKNTVEFHITSLKPIRKLNAPDAWEVDALTNFEKGTYEILNLVETDTGKWYRYMAPLNTEKSCLKCHAAQGYKLNDVRGGISVSFPAEPYLSGVAKQLTLLIAVHLMILLIGYIAIYYIYQYSNRYYLLLKENNAMLIRSNETKDTFFSIIAHDIRSPLASVVGFVDLLQFRYSDLSDDLKVKYIGYIKDATKSLSELVDNLLVWARAQRNQILLNRTSIQVFALVSESIKPYLLGAQTKNIKIDLQIDNTIFVQADIFMLKTIIANLFSNAVKYTPMDGLVSINVMRTNDVVCFVFKDSGVGLSNAKIEEILYAKLPSSTEGTNKEKGTGLGILLCRLFVKEHGGHLSIKSIENNGAEFSFTIPD